MIFTDTTQHYKFLRKQKIWYFSLNFFFHDVFWLQCPSTSFRLTRVSVKQSSDNRCSTVVYFLFKSEWESIELKLHVNLHKALTMPAPPGNLLQIPVSEIAGPKKQGFRRPGNIPRRTLVRDLQCLSNYRVFITTPQNYAQAARSHPKTWEWKCSQYGSSRRPITRRNRLKLSCGPAYGRSSD
jgi:hypothetical protein